MATSTSPYLVEFNSLYVLNTIIVLRRLNSIMINSYSRNCAFYVILSWRNTFEWLCERHFDFIICLNDQRENYFDFLKMHFYKQWCPITNLQVLLFLKTNTARRIAWSRKFDHQKVFEPQYLSKNWPKSNVNRYIILLFCKFISKTRCTNFFTA